MWAAETGLGAMAAAGHVQGEASTSSGMRRSLSLQECGTIMVTAQTF